MIGKAVCTICGLDWAVSNRTIPYNYICPRCQRIDQKRDWRQKKRANRKKRKGSNKMTNLSIAEDEE